MNIEKRTFVSLCVFGLLVLSLSCGGGDGDGDGVFDGANVAGTWTGTETVGTATNCTADLEGFEFDVADEIMCDGAELSVTFVQNGGSLTGTATCVSELGSSGASLTGTVDGQQLTVKIKAYSDFYEVNYTVSYTGTVNGNSIVASASKVVVEDNIGQCTLTGWSVTLTK